MYELKLIYYAVGLNRMITHSETFSDIFDLKDWISENVSEFNFQYNQMIQYNIIKKEEV